MLATTIGVTYGAGVHDGAASHSCIEPTSKPFGDGEMLAEFGPHVVSGEVSDFSGAGVYGCVDLALLCGCRFRAEMAIWYLRRNASVRSRKGLRGLRAD